MCEGRPLTKLELARRSLLTAAKGNEPAVFYCTLRAALDPIIQQPNRQRPPPGFGREVSVDRGSRRSGSRARLPRCRKCNFRRRVGRALDPCRDQPPNRKPATERNQRPHIIPSGTPQTPTHHPPQKAQTTARQICKDRPQCVQPPAQHRQRGQILPHRTGAITRLAQRKEPRSLHLHSAPRGKEHRLSHHQFLRCTFRASEDG